MLKRSFTRNFMTISRHSLLIKIITLFALLISFAAQGKQILVYGDSLSAAYGIPEESGWVSLLKKDLSADTKLSNASISGETTAGGLARLEVTIEQFKPVVVLLQLGANDGLRGYPLTAMRSNLEKMVALLKQHNITVVICGITLPSSYGPRYIDLFSNTFKDLADEQNVQYLNLAIPAILNDRTLVQNDGLHPTQQAQPLIKDYVLKSLTEMKLIE